MLILKQLFRISSQLARTCIRTTIASLLLGILVSCFTLRTDPGPTPRVGFIPHVESVQAPPEVSVGVPADFTLSLSAQLFPELLDQPLQGHRLFAMHRSESFVVGRSNGTYGEGMFRGLIIDPGGAFGPATDIGPASASVVLTVTFDSPGEQTLYIGHAKLPANGGLEVSELITNSGYPPEAESIEYLPVTVNVAP